MYSVRSHVVCVYGRLNKNSVTLTLRTSYTHFLVLDTLTLPHKQPSNPPLLYIHIYTITQAPQNLVWLVGITLALRHEVFDDLEAAILSGTKQGSSPSLDGSPFGNQKRIYGHTCILWTCLVLGLLVRCTISFDENN